MFKYFVITYELTDFFSDGPKFALLAETLQLHSMKVFSFLVSKVAAREACFHFPKSSVYLMNSDTENGLSGLSEDTTVGELYDIQYNSESNQMFTEGRVKVKGKKIRSAKDIVS